MNLDEAIQSLVDEMEKQIVLGHPEHIDNLEQMAEWLRELKDYRENTCGDAISRQAVLDGLASIAKAKAKSDAQKSLMGRVMFFTEQLPSVTPQQRTGHWVLLDECANSGYYCSECQKKLVKEGWSKTVKKIKFCPNCGAKMESPQNLKYADNDTMMPAT